VFPAASPAAFPSSAPGSASRGVPSLGGTMASALPTCDTSNMPPLMAEVVFSLRNCVGFHEGGGAGLTEGGITPNCSVRLCVGRIPFHTVLALLRCCCCDQGDGFCHSGNFASINRHCGTPPPPHPLAGGRDMLCTSGCAVGPGAACVRACVCVYPVRRGETRREVRPSHRGAPFERRQN
jgi:hypothetical protein